MQNEGFTGDKVTGTATLHGVLLFSIPLFALLFVLVWMLFFS